MACYTKIFTPACFTPTNTAISPEEIMHFTVYNDPAGTVKAVYLQNINGAIIDPTIYQGGGTFALGACASSNTTEFLVDCKIDDVAGDGSNLVNYYTISTRELVNGLIVVTPLGDFVDEKGVTPYVATNPTTFDALGTLAEESHGRIVLNGANTWSPTRMTKSYNITVIAVGDVNNAPTFTDSFGTITNLNLGESPTYEVSGDQLLGTLPAVTSKNGDKIIITYIETTG